MSDMKKLLSLPPNVVESFHDITQLSREQYFCTCDPVGRRLGSGGGTAWLLWQDFLTEKTGESSSPCSPRFSRWLAEDKRILIHAGGQSRRLPSYAVQGKALMPVPVFRWERGQRIGQTLLDLQLPLYERIMASAPERLHTMVVSGDVYIRATQPIGTIPDADVVCYGLWLDAHVARNHGVFVSDRKSPQQLKQMLQKPSVEQLTALQRDHFYLTDIGLWLLSDRAVEVLMRKCTRRTSEDGGDACPSARFTDYDLYGEFGCALGTNPTAPDDEVSSLTVAVVPLPGGEFYHFGTSREMISSTLRIQNLVSDQRQIMHIDHKPHPSIFIQNAEVRCKLTAENTNIWIENSYVGEGWQLSRDNIITGVPRNDWNLHLLPGECVDVVPVGDSDYEVRRYHIDEAVDSNAVAERANLRRLFSQRSELLNACLPLLAANWEHSVFYQTDLADMASRFKAAAMALPAPLPATAPLMTRIHDAMLHDDSQQAFSLLREGLTHDMYQQPVPHRERRGTGVCTDQIVWGRSPVRIDIAGGWTDTPPYCLMEGGTVVNLAIELNGQPPLQVYAKPCPEPHIVLRSIDLGATEIVATSDQLSDFNKVGSPFSIPKAALTLAGFGTCCAGTASPGSGDTLRRQLEDFGSGIELTLLSAIPAGSGLGTSSILAATVLGVLSDFCHLGWDKSEICHRTLMLEQLLTTGGGWQDQFGGVLGGVKLLQTNQGFNQSPVIRWLPNDLWTLPEYQACHLLYYTGITRTAKHILAEIVRHMFLNQHEQLLLLRQMKEHTMQMYEAIQRQDFRQTGLLLRRNWQQNQQIDSGTNPAAVQQITNLIDDLCYGYKLPGAGGGGYLYMIAKDPEAALRIRQLLNANSRNANARFVDMTLSPRGLQISRS